MQFCKLLEVGEATGLGLLDQPGNERLKQADERYRLARRNFLITERECACSDLFMQRCVFHSFKVRFAGFVTSNALAHSSYDFVVHAF